MTTSTTDNQTAQASPTVEKPETTKKGRTRAGKRYVAPSKAKSVNQTHAAKKRAKAPTKATQAAGARPGSKTARVLDLLKQPGGASLQAIMRATHWQPHSVRGFLSGLGKKMGRKVLSTKSHEGGRVYRLAT